MNAFPPFLPDLRGNSVRVILTRNADRRDQRELWGRGGGRRLGDELVTFFFENFAPLLGGGGRVGRNPSVKPEKEENSCNYPNLAFPVSGVLCRSEAQRRTSLSG